MRQLFSIKKWRQIEVTIRDVMSKSVLTYDVMLSGSTEQWCESKNNVISLDVMSKADANWRMWHWLKFRSVMWHWIKTSVDDMTWTWFFGPWCDVEPKIRSPFCKLNQSFVNYALRENAYKPERASVHLIESVRIQFRFGKPTSSRF